MSVLICGSVAYDNIMVFPDRFKKHILPEKVHMLNVSFMVPEMRRGLGGCAGNIAYNLNLLGGDGIPMGTVGTDFRPYAEWMDKHAINRKHIKIIEGTLTAQAFVITDLDDNQIIAFHPGAMSFAHENQVSDAEGINLGILAPDGREGMEQHSTQFVKAGIPFIFDPGQGLAMFNAENLKAFIRQANWMVVNDYEWEVIQKRTGFSSHDIVNEMEALIITKGAKGSVICTKEHFYEIPAVKAKRIKDPTGCGDAYRAGLLFGMMNKMEWNIIGHIASLMGAYKVEHDGTQNHFFSLSEFQQRFKENFGYDF